MKNLLYILVLLPALAFGQTVTVNYVKRAVYREQATTTDLTKAKVNITYFDGLGRPIQKIAGKASATGKDIITHIEYDSLGRQPKDYLPYASGTNTLAFDASAQANTLAFYYTADYESTTNPYSEKFFEASPLDRVRKQGAPGTPWLGNAANDNDHTVKTAYLVNVASEVNKLRAVATWNAANKVYDISFVANGTYAAGMLYKTITQDENKTGAVYTGSSTASKLNTTEEFKNKEGQVILKRIYNSIVNSSGVTITQTLDTYNVYDQFGNLTYVLPPLAAGAFVDELCYQYKYDARNRLVEKKLPGRQWEFMVYDKLDRVVAIGPVFTPFGGTAIGWSVTRFDAFGRTAYTGWVAASGSTIDSAARKAKQDEAVPVVSKVATAVLVDGVYINYNAFPTGIKMLSSSYYDNYTFYNAPAAPNGLISVESQTANSNVKGLATGSWIRALTLATETFGESGYNYYDLKGRLIRSYTTNYLGGYTQTDSKLDFDGTTTHTTIKHKRLASDTELAVYDDYAYTLQDRLLSHTNTIGSLTPHLLGYNTYNELGQLTQKKVGGTDLTAAAALQYVDYSYTVRGWLKGINNTGNLNGGVGAPVDLFALKINYTDAIDNNISGKVQPLYNANIAETSWRTASDNIVRRYGYTYDKLNRLTDAWYQIPQTSVPVRDSYDERMQYDVNGNITKMARNGGSDMDTAVIGIDDLTYTYDGTKKNQLIKVVDGSNNTQGFKDGTNTGNDYTYDLNGNMLTDLNKGITSIVYNHLNQPVEVQFGSASKKINYLYNAAGIKLRKVVTDTSVTPATVTTDYLEGGFQYLNSVLEFFATEEGYVKNTVSAGVNNYTYAYNYKDQVGNIRLSYAVDPSDNVLKILEENHFYPFGLKHSGYSSNQLIITKNPAIVIVPVVNQTDITYRYKFQEQERQDEFGLNWDSFKYRNYDYAIGRFMSIDPLAEKYTYNSPYAFQENKMGLGRELEGLEMIPERSKDGKSATITYHVNPINNSRLSTDDFNTLVQARVAIVQKEFSGKTAEGISLTTKVVIDSKATVSWEYNEMINVNGTQTGNALGYTDEVGNTQVNRTQVNVFSELGANASNGKLNDLQPSNVSEMAITGGEEDNHVGGVPDIGRNKIPILENKMLNDPKKNMLHHNTGGSNMLPEQRSLILKNALQQYKP